MLFFYGFDVGDFSEVQLVDFMADVQGFDVAFHDHSGEDVLVAVTADVEVAGDLLDCERSNQPAAIIFGKCLFGDLVLSHLIGLSQQFIISALDSSAL